MEQSRRHPDDPLLWAQAYRRFDGQPMVVPPALHEIYRDDHPRVVVQKPAQVGITEYNVNYAFWAAWWGLGERGNVLYLMPTQEHVARLSQARLAKAINDSPALAQLFGEQTFGAQRVQLRTLRNGSIHFAGTDQARQYQGIDADLVILDEFDLMKDEVLPNATARLRSSREPRMRITSTPTIPMFGVNGLMQESTDHHYELLCGGCTHWIEPQFPDNVDFERNLVVCRCGSALRWDGEGRWVARQPGRRDYQGYQLNRLTLPNPPLQEMRLAAKQTVPGRREQFWRQDLGVPFITDDARLTPADIERCRADYPAGLFSEGIGGPKRTVVGIDVGTKSFWVVARTFWEGRSYLIGAQRVDGDWEDLVAYLKTRPIPINYIVVDALPDTRGAMRLQREMRPTISFICYYTRKQGHDYSWHDPRTINADRTLALDETFDGFRRGESLIPPSGMAPVDADYEAHLQALVRTAEPDEFGQLIPTYVHTRPDDFAHAETYISLFKVKYGRHWSVA